MQDIIDAINVFRKQGKLVLFGKEYKQLSSREEMYQQLDKRKVRYRTSLEADNIAISRVDKGDTDNSILGIYLYNENIAFIVVENEEGKVT